MAPTPTPQDIQALQQEASALEQLAIAAKKAYDETGKLPDNIGKLTERIEKNASSGGKLSAAMGQVSKATKDVGNAAKEASEKAKEFFDNLTGGNFSISSIIENVRLWSASHENLIGVLKKSYVQIDAFRNNVFTTVQSFQNLRNEVGGSSKLISDFGEAVSKSDKILKLPGGEKIAQITKNFFDAMSATNAFETSLLRATTAGGSTGAMLSYIGREGESLQDNLGQVMTATINRAKDLGISTGIGFEEAMTQVTAVMQNLPRELNQVYKILDNNNKDYALNTEQLLSKVAAGVGVKTEKAIEIASGMFSTFGSNAREASERLAVMTKAGKDLQIELGPIEELIKGLDNSFALWGDQAEGTLDILRNVSSALEGSGVGFKGQISIVQNLTGAFEKMSLGMKSFIGVQSGLRGGAVSAGLQIEKMMQEGRMSELAGMMQQTLEKRTGRGAVTLAEAVESPQSQAVFLQQRALLQTMGVAGEAAQNRILEAMSKVQIGAATGEDAGAAFKAALSKGDSTQERQSNDIAAIKDNTEKSVNLLSMISAANVGREVFSGTAFGNILREELRSRQGKGDSGQESFESATQRIMGDLIRAEAESIPLITNTVATLATTIGTVQRDISNAIKKDSGKPIDQEPNFLMKKGMDWKKAAKEQEESLNKMLGAEPPKTEKPKPILQPTKTTSLSKDELSILQQELVKGQSTEEPKKAALAVSKLASTSIEDFAKTKNDLIAGTIAAYKETEAQIRSIYKNDQAQMKSKLDEASSRAQSSIDSIRAITPESLPKIKAENIKIEVPERREELKINLDYKEQTPASLSKIKSEISSELKRATPVEFEEKKISLREGFTSSYKENMDRIKEQYSGNADLYKSEMAKLDKVFNPIQEYIAGLDSTKLSDLSGKIPATKRPTLSLGEPTTERLPTLRGTTMEATASNVKTEVQGEVAVNITIYTPEGQNIAQDKIISTLVRKSIQNDTSNRLT